jgi:hypothetical protein
MRLERFERRNIERIIPNASRDRYGNALAAVVYRHRELVYVPHSAF